MNCEQRNQQPCAQFVQEPPPGEVVIVENGVEDPRLPGLNYLAITSEGRERIEPFLMRREALPDGRRSWDGFEAEGARFPSRMEIIDGGAIRVGFYDHYFQALENRVSDPSGKRIYATLMEAAGKSCWDFDELDAEIAAKTEEKQ